MKIVLRFSLDADIGWDFGGPLPKNKRLPNLLLGRADVVTGFADKYPNSEWAKLYRQYVKEKK